MVDVGFKAAHGAIRSEAEFYLIAADAHTHSAYAKADAVGGIFAPAALFHCQGCNKVHRVLPITNLPCGRRWPCNSVLPGRWSSKSCSAPARPLPDAGSRA